MNKLKVLILGSAGMAGHIIKKHLSSFPEKIDVYDVARSSKYIHPSFLLDVTDFSSLNNLIFDLRPDCIINCIGILNETAESNPDLAILVNSYLPHFLESKTKASYCKIIHISTDCVFSGLKGDYVEKDPKDGIGIYAQSKALGEIINNKDLTIRTSIIGPELNPNGIGLLHWFLNQKNDITGYTKAFWSGVTTTELAKFIYFVLSERFDLNGIYHLTNNTKIDKCSLLKFFQGAFKKEEIKIISSDKYKIDKSLINTNDEILYNVSEYKNMVNEMRDYIIKNKTLYHYDFLA